MTLPHPWAELRAQPHIVVSFRTDLPPGMRGASNGRDTIILSSALRQAERRATLAHELEHLDHGDTCRDPRIEPLVRATVARRMIPMDHLIDKAKWARSIEELADELWVPVDVVEDRLRALSPLEQQMIWALVRAHQERGAD